MATAGIEVMSRADAAWLNTEAPTNHFVVTSLGLMSEPINPERFKTMLASRLEATPRLRQVVAQPPAPFLPQRWVPARDFDIDAHVQHVALPAPAGHAELEEFIGGLVGQGLDFDRPLWKMYLVDGPDHKGAIVTRFHHALGDGPAMVRMMLSLTDATREGWRHPAVAPRHVGQAGAPIANVRSAMRLATSVPLKVAAQGLAAAGTLAKLTMLDEDPPTSLRGPLGLIKRVAWTEPISIDIIRRTAKATGTTINDVVVSAIAGALGDWLRTNGEKTKGLRIRAMVPFSMRSSASSVSGNDFSLVFLDLPVGVVNPIERLMRVRVEMDRIKGSLEPQVGWLMVQSLGLLTPPLEKVVAKFYADKASVVITNVIGPDHPVYIAGSRLRAMTFWEPESGGLGIGVSIYSYAGKMIIGVVSDRNLVARPSVITAAFTSEFRKLVRAAGG